MTGSEGYAARDGHLFLSLLQARAGTSVVSRLGATDPAGIPAMDVGAFRRLTGASEKTLAAFVELRGTFEPEETRERLAEAGYSTVTPADGGYPERLRGVPDPPPALYVGGALPDGPAVALVGSRKASVTGLESARTLGRALARRGVCVVSGLALGIDAAAHEGALEAGGAAVGVLGSGIDGVYPRSNRRLFEGVRESGALVSEYFLGEPPLRWRFPARNRVITGLSDCVVVVEAGEKSGALITARHAADAGRDVWAAPGPLGFPECRGSNRLLADGAAVLWDVDEFVEAVAPEPQAPPRLPVAEGGLPAELPAGERAVLAGVGFEPSEADVIATRTSVGMRELLSALTLLELKGYVRRDERGAFVRAAVRGGGQ